MKKISSILTIIIALSLILCGCASDNGHTDDTDTGTDAQTPVAHPVVSDDKVHYVGPSTTDSYLIAINKIIHIINLNEENAVPQCFCRDTECDHSGGDCTAEIGISYPVIIDSGDSSIMYWMHKQSRGQITDKERLAEIEEVLGGALRSSGAFYEYDLKTGERRLIAECLPFLERPDFYYNGKIYMDASLDDMRTLKDSVTSKKYHSVYCVDMATGDYTYLDVGKNTVPIGIYDEKLYFTDAETYTASGTLEAVTVTDGKIYAASLDLSEYDVYAEIGLSYDLCYASDGVFYFCVWKDNSIYALDVTKNEKEPKKIAENVAIYSVQSANGDVYYSVNDKHTIEYGDRTTELDTNGIVYCYDSETGTTEELFGKNAEYEIKGIDYADEEKIIFFGIYYGEYEGIVSNAVYEYSFETNEIKELYVYE